MPSSKPAHIAICAPAAPITAEDAALVTRLAAAHARYVTLGCPDVDLRAAQDWLNYLGLPTGGIDGIAGQATTAALRSFQKSAGLAITGKPDAPTLAALKAKFG